MELLKVQEGISQARKIKKTTLKKMSFIYQETELYFSYILENRTF